MIKLAELSGTADEIALATDIRNHLIDWLQTTSLKDAGPIKDNEIFAIHVEWLANEVLQYASDSSWWISCSEKPPLMIIYEYNKRGVDEGLRTYCIRLIRKNALIPNGDMKKYWQDGEAENITETEVQTWRFYEDVYEDMLAEAYSVLDTYTCTYEKIGEAIEATEYYIEIFCADPGYVGSTYYRAAIDLSNVVPNFQQEPMTRLKSMRKAAGLSQRQLAEMAGMKLRTLQCYEEEYEDLSDAPSQTLLSLATALGCSTEDLID